MLIDCHAAITLLFFASAASSMPLLPPHHAARAMPARHRRFDAAADADYAIFS